ncbi:AraC family transcriptional regulator [Paucibacter sp. B2R-40]|uniref:helix-turn-helix transcriptional regulator n=1 Tax=Paucibacter sp. B2R-40 TaxID=2893554 RepID=UPI0021E49D38|nr:AraC family transcriptional regulator [Paucibacter sp. B2R-40]MCV2354335.1 AraC family transcriptional regulator [Paucibacter sp. B2R-40]
MSLSIAAFLGVSGRPGTVPVSDITRNAACPAAPSMVPCFWPLVDAQPQGALGDEETEPATSIPAGTTMTLRWKHMSHAWTKNHSTEDVQLHLPIDGRVAYRIGLREHIASKGAAMLIAPGWAFTCQSPPGSLLILCIEGNSLLAELEARQPHAKHAWALRSKVLPAQCLESESFLPSLVDLIEAREPDARREREAGLMGRLAELLIKAPAIARVSALETQRLAALEEWIDAHLSESITIGRMCEVVGVSERRLQQTFETLRGMSPKRWLTERRLAFAHRLLWQRDHNGDVTRVAIEAGFAHLGRFSAQGGFNRSMQHIG